MFHCPVLLEERKKQKRGRGEERDFGRFSFPCTLGSEQMRGKRSRDARNQNDASAREPKLGSVAGEKATMERSKRVRTKQGRLKWIAIYPSLSLLLELPRLYPSHPHSSPLSHLGYQIVCYRTTAIAAAHASSRISASLIYVVVTAQFGETLAFVRCREGSVYTARLSLDRRSG